MPTQAQQVLSGFKTYGKTISVLNYSKLLDPQVSFYKCPDGTTVYTFSDGSVLLTSGRGQFHKMEVA